MKAILGIQMMRMHKEWKVLLTWLLLPLLLTVLTFSTLNKLGDESKVPIGLVIEENTTLSDNLVKRIMDTDYLLVNILDLPEATDLLEKHELDSVFVIKDGYEEDILNNRRSQLLEAYSSNRSFAYFAVVETISSYVQEEATRTKAATEIKNLYEKYGSREEWDREEIFKTSKEKQEKKQLISTSFSFQWTPTETGSESTSLLSVWGIWAFFQIIATLFLFDWVVKANSKLIKVRWTFTKISLNSYIYWNLLFYTVLLFVMDVVTIYVLHILDLASPSARLFIALLGFRVTINILAALLAKNFTNSFFYYICAIAISLILTICGGAFIPIDSIISRWPWVESFSPVYSLLHGEIAYGFLAAIIVISIVKGGSQRAASKFPAKKLS
ncbi:ABC transporter permease [Psychrobacillus sp. INOP01]|uniref:ABC transporter permease n=1 Tax=Psychrobacillus sp. INOP01 TaxID=2829187 RepID=UPI001BAB39A7|nr:ABC transporter permease [Psychrobacillus sp. INOP01]QUG40659.1 ABC transporter permease [Psychrobacillus sp. INOP01]